MDTDSGRANVNAASMRIVQLVAGAGRMYCGACMRDNRLAAKLRQQGRDVVLIPLYTPIRTDEIDVSVGRVYYGGLNVYLQQKSAVFRHLPAAIDRILDSHALLRGVGRLAAKTRPADLGALTVAVLTGEHGAQRRELEKLIAGLRALAPTLISLPNLMFAGTARALKGALNVPILCTLAGEDAFLDALETPFRDQAFELIQQGAEHIDAFIAPTKYYAARAVEYFGLNRGRVHYVPMGIRVDDFSRRATPPPDPFTIGFLAGICPEKGLAELCAAFTLLRQEHPSCRLRVAGYCGTAGRTYWAGIHRQLGQHGLQDAVDFLGEVSRPEKHRFLRSLHVLSVPTVHPEPKGLYVLEAMATGVPVVQPRHGAFPELVEATCGGRLYDPTGPRALADAIAELIVDDTHRRQLAESGRAAVGELYSDDVMAEQTWLLYQRYGGCGEV